MTIQTTSVRHHDWMQPRPQGFSLKKCPGDEVGLDVIIISGFLHSVVTFYSGGPKGGARGAAPLLVDQTEARRAEKKFLSDRPPPPPFLRVWMTAPHPLLCYID